MQNLFFRLFFVAAMLGITLGTAGSVSAQKVHVITVADTNADIFFSVASDAAQFSDMLNKYIAPEQFGTQISIGDSGSQYFNYPYVPSWYENYDSYITGWGPRPPKHMREGNKELHPQAILKRIREMSDIGSDDAVVFYYSGHGAMDGDTKERYFAITDESTAFVKFAEDIRKASPMEETNWRHKKKMNNLLKSEVIKTIERHNPRLIVVIGDCCSGYVPYTRKERRETMPRGEAYEPAIREKKIRTAPLFKKLFFETGGLVDFTAAQDDMLGYCYPLNAVNQNRRMGSTMTFALCSAMRSERSKRVSWDRIFLLTQDRTRTEAYQFCKGEIKDALTEFSKGDLIPHIKEIGQYPKAFALGNRARSARGADMDVLGMNVAARQEGGVAVSKVKPKTAATNAGFEVGDVITEVNDKAVNSKEDFDAAVSAAGTVINFTVLDVKTGKPTIWPVAIYLPAE